VGVVLVFSSASAAARVVAGLPAAARALREAAEAGVERCAIAVPGGWMPDRSAKQELDRLAGGVSYAIVDTAAMPQEQRPRLLVRGECLVAAERLRAGLAGEGAADGSLVLDGADHGARLTPLSPAEARAMLDRAARAIVAGTAKASDGIVSQLINRPISQAISRQLLRFTGVNPFAVTVGAAALAIAMLAALVFGGARGLVVGAVLYQLASIVDGVDGEIARATFRNSKAGAMADSLVDAVTNVGFLAGLAINLWIQGHVRPAIAGVVGLAAVAAGLFLIGRRAQKSTEAFSFDGVKDHFRKRRSWLFQMLIWLTMRDFLALAWLVTIIAGGAGGGLLLFGTGAVVWVVVVLFVLRPQAT
jgi:CDP-L-myo-inositol myo-inositolphosphotransferase